MKIHGETGNMTFFHGQFAQAVHKRYLATARLLTQAHADLAKFYHGYICILFFYSTFLLSIAVAFLHRLPRVLFSTNDSPLTADSHLLPSRADPTKDGAWTGGNDVRAIKELPYHLKRGEMWIDLASVLTDLHFVEIKIALGLTQDLIADYNAATAEDAKFDKVCP